MKTVLDLELLDLDTHELIAIDAHGEICSACGRVPDFKVHLFDLTVAQLGIPPQSGQARRKAEWQAFRAARRHEQDAA
ncbi:MAG: hypothetical protein ABJB33_06100 [Gemmatimonadota bacterium]